MPKAKQPSRKTKATWRKNIDLSGVEARLENERAAERVGMAPVDEATSSGALFVEDRQGDAKVAKRMQTGKKPLRSLAILQENKDVGAPPVLGRARKGVVHATAKGTMTNDLKSGGLTPEQRALRSGISRKDIERLRRAAGRDVRGAFGIIKEQEDGEEDGALRRGPEAVIGSAYDVWSTPDMSNGSSEKATDEDSLTSKRKPRAPRTIFEVRTTDVALPLPDEGQSYNPAAAAHEALLNKALRQAMQDEEKRRTLLEYSRKWNSGVPQSRASAGAVSDVEAIEQLLGMRVGVGDEDQDDQSDIEEKALAAEVEEDENEETEVKANKKQPKRKTKQQRARAKRAKEELRARMAAKAEKQAKAQVYKLRTIKAHLLQLEEENIANAARRQAARQSRLAERVGMRKLPVREEEVQLGEDLSDSLRGLKPEGNLLRDRVHAFQKRGLIEPRQSTALSGKAKGATRRKKEYETHAYKRFS